MGSLSGLGIGLSVMFVCFVVAIVAEIYCVFWWRKRRINSAAQDHEIDGDDEDGYMSQSPTRELFYLLCWKRNHGDSISTRALNTNIPSEAAENRFMNDDGDCHVGLPTSPESPVNSEFVTKLWSLPSEGMDSELMRIHGLLGPPRILFTIKEETKEDMESEDGKSRGGKSKRGSHSRSLSDLLSQIGSEFGGGSIICPSPADTPPFMTPSSSPPFHTPFTTPPLTPLHHHYPSPGHNKSKSCDEFLKSQNLIDDVVDGRNLDQDKKLLQGTVALDIDDGPLKNSPALTGDENASFITILVNDDTYKLKG